MATATKTRRKRGSRRRGRHRAPSGHELVWSALPELVRDFRKHDLLTYASALSFQVLTAIIPFVLFGLGVLGFFDLKSVWTSDIASHIRPNVSHPAFTVINSTVTKVLTQKQLFWVTAGFALAIWEISGGVRAVMNALDRIYRVRDERSWLQRVRRSIALALVVAALVIAAIAVVWLGPVLYGDAGGIAAVALFVVRWAIAAVLLGLAVGLTIRLAPDSPQPAGWVSFGTVLTVSAWMIASILFGLYVKLVASYGSIFGNLATIVVLMLYLYMSSIVFFAGVQIDAIIRRRVEGNAQGR
ncbi:MAG: YihY/virulence factor BrkB family protein [Thermoleophilaceae bacterium]